MHRVFIFFFHSLLILPSIIAQDSLPNIVVILVDDVGYGETGMQGNPEIPTPNIDRLAQNGVRFTSGYVTASYCSPSRAGLLTGRYQNRYLFNPTGYLNEDPKYGMPLSETTMAEYLLEAGYVSAIVGKWHLGGAAQYHPYHHGYDEFYGFLHEGHYYAPFPYDHSTTMLRRKVLPGGNTGRLISEDERLIYHTEMGHNEPDYNANNPIMRGSQPHHEEEYLTDALIREAVNFIDRHRDKPFFLYLPYNAVHSPLQSQNNYCDKFSSVADIQHRIFAGMLANLDAGVGQVVDKLRKEGLEENTIIFLLSDNGGPTRELTSSNAPLKGGKGTSYEGGICIPFLLQWKKEIPAGMDYKHPITSLDILPTLLAAANQPIPEKMDGVNLIPYLKNENSSAPHDVLYWETSNFSALRNGDWKIVRQKLNNDVWQLYDVVADISESKNLATQNSEKLNELVALWNTMNLEINSN